MLDTLVIPKIAAMPCPALRAEARLRPLVGNTPLVPINMRDGDGFETIVYAKAEFKNLTGSVKDRMALSVLCQARKRGDLRAGQEVVEMSSGNAGIALAAIGRVLGHPVTIFMPDWMSTERRLLMEMYGAKVRLVSAGEGGFLGAKARAEDYALAESAFLARQFENDDNAGAHETGTGQEVIQQLCALGLVAGAFVAGVGTGGTVAGVARAFAAAGLSAPVHGIEPAESPTLSTGYRVGRHRIQGISDEFVPDLYAKASLASPIAVSDEAAISVANACASSLGLGVGISSGANLYGAFLRAKEGGLSGPVATVLCDDALRYASTSLLGRLDETCPVSLSHG